MHLDRCFTLGMFGIALLVATGDAAVATEPSPWQWTEVPRIVAIGDVHGSYDKLLKLLRGTGLVDDQLSWSGGKSHLVFVGDLIDRGPDDRQVLDLARRLQTEAETAGGKVHTLLGNHEVMNLSGDLRYVTEKGFKDFLPEEDRKARNRAMQNFRTRVAPGIALTDLKPAFEKRFPPGYFGRLQAFWYDGEYGSWLLEQPAVIMINGVIFVHGGLTKEIAPLGLDGINDQVHESIRSFMQNGQELVQLTGAPPSYADALRMAHQLGDSSAASNRAMVARTVLQLTESLPYVPSGPLWYRGVSTETERLERHSVENTLDRLDARSMVIAHTPTASGRINSRFNNTVFRVDVGMAYGREPLALVFEGDKTTVYDPASGSYGTPLSEPHEGEGFSRFNEQLPEEQMLKFLREAKVNGCREETRGVRFANICDLEQKDLHLRAVFQTVDESPGNVDEEPKSVPRTYRNEIAAYLIDRRLEIGLVPATVERTIDGETGSLQIWLESALDQKLLEIYDQMHLLDDDAVQDQIIRAEAFMAFIDVHKAYESVGVMLLPLEKRLQVADSTKAFSIVSEPNPDLMTPPCPRMEPDRELFLRLISHQDIKTVAGQYLSDEQIEALLARRDKMLDACYGPAKTAASAR